jgi:hypothetical protein
MEIMKKALVLAMLLSGLFLFGCSSGRDTTASSNDSNPSSDTGGGGGGSQSGSNSVFTLNLVDDVDGVRAAARYTSPGSPPEATDVRVVIRRYETLQTSTLVCQYDDNDVVIPDSCSTVTVTSYTEVYKDIQDVPYNTGGTVSIGIPEGTGYTLDVITSKLESGNHSILKYGQATGVAVGPSNTSATITIKTINTILNMTVADSVVSKGKFNVTLNNALPLAPNYKMTMSFGGNVSSVVSSSTNTCTFTAPVSYSAGTISLQGEFTIHNSFLIQSETQAQWTRIFPNGAYSEEVSSQLSPLWAVVVPII